MNHNNNHNNNYYYQLFGKVFICISIVWNLYTIYYIQSITTRNSNNEYNHQQHNQQQHLYYHHQQSKNCIETTSSITTTQEIPTDNNNNNNNRCYNEFQRVTMNHIQTGLTKDDYERSIAHVGNRYRISQFITKLIHSSSISVSVSTKTNTNNTSSSTTTIIPTPVTVIVCGGSISIGHGVEPKEGRYSDILEIWLNEMYPIITSNNNNNNNNEQQQQQQQEYRHRVYNRGGHGANICSMAKRLNYMDLPSIPDLFILEFAVNNYQGEDYSTYVDHKTDVYFRGYEQIVECTEIVIGWILYKYPKTAILLFDLHTAVPNRKTAQSLHVGVAQHYQIPVISYADTMMPEYFRLIETLKPYNYNLPNTMIDQMNINFPYPHGCTDCRLQDMTEQFRPYGCYSLCKLLQEGQVPGTNCNNKPRNTQPCYVPMYDHDEVHLSKVGHAIARDIISYYMAQIAYNICQGQTYQPYSMPIHGGWMIGSSTSDQSYISQIMALSDYVLVQDLKHNFASTPYLQPYNYTSGFKMEEDWQSRKGWVATNPKGMEQITFDINLPMLDCYAVYITILKSYQTVGALTASIYDRKQNRVTKTMDIDCLWGPHISVPMDIQITSDNTKECTGKCYLTITTHKKIKDGRNGNLINIKSLSVRRCV